MSADSSPTVAVTVKQRRIPRWLLRPAVSDVTGRRRRHLRSVAVRRLTVPRGCLSQNDFVSVGPTVWISPPKYLLGPAVGHSFGCSVYPLYIL